MFYKNKKGTIGKTINWLFATIVIVIILIISIVVANFLGAGGHEFYLSRFRDPIIAKSLSAYLLTPDNSGKIIFEQLKENETLSDFNGNLALRVFDELYKEEYSVARWFGIDSLGFRIRKNDYFGSIPTAQKGGDIYSWKVPTILEKIRLDEDKWVSLILQKRKNE